MTPDGGAALGLWTLCLSWACSGPRGWVTGRVPIEVVEYLAPPHGPDWRDLMAALIDVGLWEADGEVITFHDWDDWNGPSAQRHRSREQTRVRTNRARRK